ncbi:hypothetical protein FQN55_000066 [Onygenales sp. PD_40]|nr:hypothetical protein FQN55_000066 [Onygenales sp. PD_40]KAK2776707.1 hypothetical protein FQN53_002529 [Emmonsiellopsis sp. PD_33]KAK2788742.1 hypothetical protein FQN52_006498 [Onygenales sp. PD_12]KAK2801148.1 hypothetical protein FQN51_005463 [Onygenales sp. PD_10]
MSVYLPLARRADEPVGRPDKDPDGLILEGWAQGFMVGTLVFMAAITIANMRRRVLLHKLILAELILAMGHGTWLFTHAPVYGWWLSTTAIGLNMSWSLHNLIAWMKNRPFLSKNVSIFYIGSVILVQPYWVLEIYANFTYFNNINKIFEKTRPFETLFRDPWWIYTTCNLFWVIKSQYDFTLFELVRESPRFGVMLLSMCLSIVFLVVDLMSVLHVFEGALPTGINPFWKLSFVFKCLCDTVILDDFKTALDRLRDYWLMKNGALDHLGSDTQQQRPPLGRRSHSRKSRHSNQSDSSIRRPDAVLNTVDNGGGGRFNAGRKYSNAPFSPILPVADHRQKDKDDFLEEV